MGHTNKKMKKLEKLYNKTPEKATLAKARIEKKMEKLEKRKRERSKSNA